MVVGNAAEGWRSRINQMVLCTIGGEWKTIAENYLKSRHHCIYCYLVIQPAVKILAIVKFDS